MPNRGRDTGLKRFLPRYRTFDRLEAACFAPGGRTRLLLLSEPQRAAYADVWQTEPARMAVLPPTLNARRRRPELRSESRTAMRSALGLAPNDWTWLSIGGHPETKGFDRTIAALPQFPTARLLIVGLAPDDDRARRLLQDASKLGVEARIEFLGHREDVPEVMAGADLLVHPARLETTGTVLLEAIVNGLPVVTTAVCGYAEHVLRADAGVVVAEPFRADAFIAALREAQRPELSDRWTRNGATYGTNPELSTGLERAAELMVAK
jgi:UDP-glucose:(heptosyl)LPS alpha-1,3-glucosyltransferase